MATPKRPGAPADSPFLHGVASPEAQLEGRIREAPEPALVALDKARAVRALVETGRDEAKRAWAILSVADPEAAKTLAAHVEEHAAAVDRAELVWARAYAASLGAYKPSVAAIDEADKALEIAADEAQKRAKTRG